MRRHLVNKKPAPNGSLPQQRAAAMANVRESLSPPSQSNSEQMEVNDDASL